MDDTCAVATLASVDVEIAHAPAGFARATVVAARVLRVAARHRRGVRQGDSAGNRDYEIAAGDFLGREGALSISHGRGVECCDVWPMYEQYR
jgi:hypothetical protein